jgi:signal transduction histidine kinase/AmiR/NasT family two-component response regulator
MTRFLDLGMEMHPSEWGDVGWLLAMMNQGIYKNNHRTQRTGERENVRVLIADDDYSISKMLKTTLEKRGYIVIGEAANGSEAVEMTQSLQPDVVLMDMKMPHMDGIEATRRIRESCPTPVVMLTAYETPELIERASKAGVGAYLIKPHDVRDIERAIAIVMARFGDVMRLRHLNAELRARRQKPGRMFQLEQIGRIIQRIAPIQYLDDLLLRAVYLIRDAFGYDHVRIYLIEASHGLLPDSASATYLGADKLVLKVSAGPTGETLNDRLRFETGRAGIAGWVARKGMPLLVNGGDGGSWHEPLPEARDAQSELAVPIVRQGQIIGVLDVQSARPGAFGEGDLFILQALASQLAISIENARLYQQTDQESQARMRELAALYAIARMMNRSLDLDEILQLALDSAIELAGMDAGGILLLDPATGELFARVCRKVSPQLIDVINHASAGEGMMPRMLKSVMVINDLSEVTEERRLAIEREGFQCMVSIPLGIVESPLGVIVMASRKLCTCMSEELEFLAAIGDQAGTAIDRANLHAQELRVAILEERQAMARQMHDDIAQTLGYLGLQVDNVAGDPSLFQNVQVRAGLEGIRRAIEDAYERVRDSIVRLRGGIPDPFDSSAAFQAKIDEFEGRTHCRVDLQVDKDHLQRLSPAVAFQAIYIVHEALTNVWKHAGADVVQLVLQGQEEGLVEITIQDNGRGFDLQGDRGGLGLRFMRERAEWVGGRLGIESQLGHGTRVVVHLPTG